MPDNVHVAGPRDDAQFTVGQVCQATGVSTGNSLVVLGMDHDARHADARHSSLRHEFIPIASRSHP